jgi:hypothetical protein
MGVDGEYRQLVTVALQRFVGGASAPSFFWPCDFEVHDFEVHDFELHDFELRDLELHDLEVHDSKLYDVEPGARFHLGACAIRIVPSLRMMAAKPYLEPRR